jgi:glycosyltransferase involved in cell wall biosynthesis
MYFSLIMATIRRTQEISRFLERLDTQTYRDFELIVVDQNSDNRLLEVLEPYKNHFPILHLHSTPGASRSRNVGIRKAKGDIIAFPDDDCWYPQDLLERVNNQLENHPEWDILSCTSAGDKYWDRQAGKVNRFNVWKRGIEYSVFLRRQLVTTLGDLDETLGVGSGTPWWAGEITDYMLRAIDKGYQIYYDPTIGVYHPGPIQTVEAVANDFSKHYHYAMGKGRVIRKSNSPFWFVTYQCTKPLVKAMLGLIQQRTEQRQIGWAVFKGIVEGWRSIDSSSP